MKRTSTGEIKVNEKSLKENDEEHAKFNCFIKVDNNFYKDSLSYLLLKYAAKNTTDKDDYENCKNLIECGANPDFTLIVDSTQSNSSFQNALRWKKLELAKLMARHTDNSKHVNSTINLIKKLDENFLVGLRDAGYKPCYTMYQYVVKEDESFIDLFFKVFGYPHEYETNIDELTLLNYAASSRGELILLTLLKYYGNKPIKISNENKQSYRRLFNFYRRINRLIPKNVDVKTNEEVESVVANAPKTEPLLVEAICHVELTPIEPGAEYYKCANLDEHVYSKKNFDLRKYNYQCLLCQIPLAEMTYVNRPGD